MLFYLVVMILQLLSFGLQEFVPAIPIAHQASLFLPMVFFLAASVATSFPMMLSLAFVTGFIWDARYLPAEGLQVDQALLMIDGGAADLMRLSGGELGFGSSILLFGLLGALMQGVRPLFRRGRLELPVLMVGFAVFGWLLSQYLMITFIRGSFNFPFAVWSKMITCTLLAMLIAPLFFLILHAMARWLQFEIRYEGLNYQYHGR